MTVMTELHERVIFPRTTLHEFWLTIQDHYAHEDPRTWKYLAMLALHENSGWSEERIGYAFGHRKGHVSRCLQAVKRALRARFDVPAGVLSEDEGFSDPCVDVQATHEHRDSRWNVDEGYQDDKD